MGRAAPLAHPGALVRHEVLERGDRPPVVERPLAVGQEQDQRAAGGRSTRFPFVELMDEVHRVLKPGGRFYAVTPDFPREEAFIDPTHVNVITGGTRSYFCGEEPTARIYGFRGAFRMLRDERALLPEAWCMGQAVSGSDRWTAMTAPPLCLRTPMRIQLAVAGGSRPTGRAGGLGPTQSAARASGCRRV